MTRRTPIRNYTWLATFAVVAGLYTVLHLKVNTMHSAVIRAEREIQQLEEVNLLLDTEFQVRSNLVQLEQWNKVDFGYSAPSAEQFIESERQLARFGSPRAANAPDPIRLAGLATGKDAPEFPQMDEGGAERAASSSASAAGPNDAGPNDAGQLAVAMVGGRVRVAIRDVGGAVQ